MGRLASLNVSITFLAILLISIHAISNRDYFAKLCKKTDHLPVTKSVVTLGYAGVTTGLTLGVDFVVLRTDKANNDIRARYEFQQNIYYAMYQYQQRYGSMPNRLNWFTRRAPLPMSAVTLFTNLTRVDRLQRVGFYFGFSVRSISPGEISERNAVGLAVNLDVLLTHNVSVTTVCSNCQLRSSSPAALSTDAPPSDRCQERFRGAARCVKYYLLDRCGWEPSGFEVRTKWWRCCDPLDSNTDSIGDCCWEKAVKVRQLKERLKSFYHELTADLMTLEQELKTCRSIQGPVGFSIDGNSTDRSKSSWSLTESKDDSSGGQELLKCPEKAIRYQGGCLWLKKKALGVASASEQCKRENGRLITLGDMKKLRVVWKAADNAGISFLWTGYSDKKAAGQYRHVTHKNLKLVNDKSVWAEGEPSGFHKDVKEDCVHVFGAGWAEFYPAVLNDFPCNVPLAYACEMEREMNTEGDIGDQLERVDDDDIQQEQDGGQGQTGKRTTKTPSVAPSRQASCSDPGWLTYRQGGVCIRFVTHERADWSTALSKCERQGATLVTLENEDKLRFVHKKATAARIGFMWVGYRDMKHEGTFVDVRDNKLALKDSWAKGEPSGSYAGIQEDCLQMFVAGWRPPKLLNDYFCNTRLMYACQLAYV